MNPAEALRELSEPSLRGERIKAVIDRLARQTGLAYWRVYDLWYGKAKSLTHQEATAIEDALQEKREREARNDLNLLKEKIARLEARLDATPSSFYRPTIDPLGPALRGAR